MNNKILDVCCTNELDFKFDHFKDVNELLENIDIWFINDDIDYERWFGLNDLHTLKVYINKLQTENSSLKGKLQQKENIIKEVREYIELGLANEEEAEELLEILDKENI